MKQKAGSVRRGETEVVVLRDLTEASIVRDSPLPCSTHVVCVNVSNFQLCPESTVWTEKILVSY